METNPQIGRYITLFSHIFVHLGTFIAISMRRNVHVLVSRVSLPVTDIFDWGALKHRIPESEWFCIGSQPIPSIKEGSPHPLNIQVWDLGYHGYRYNANAGC